MKRIGVAIAAVSVIVLVCGVAVLRGQGAAGPEAKAEKRTISTSGQATIKVKPDSARVYFGVQTLAETIKKARADNAASVKKVMDALTALQIPDLKMKSSDVHVELVQSAHDRDSLPRTLGYKVTHTDQEPTYEAEATVSKNGTDDTVQVQPLCSGRLRVRYILH